jgi:hypothetical protein
VISVDPHEGTDIYPVMQTVTVTTNPDDLVRVPTCASAESYDDCAGQLDSVGLTTHEEIVVNPEGADPSKSPSAVLCCGPYRAAAGPLGLNPALDRHTERAVDRRRRVRRADARQPTSTTDLARSRQLWGTHHGPDRATSGTYQSERETMTRGLDPFSTTLERFRS